MLEGSSNQLPFQAVDDAAVEVSDVAGDAGHLRIGDGIDQDIVAEPVDANLADGFGLRGHGCDACGEKGTRADKTKDERH